MTTTRNRVPLYSSENDNCRVKRTMRTTLGYFAEHRQRIASRLREIDQEWDIERAIEAKAALRTHPGSCSYVDEHAVDGCGADRENTVTIRQAELQST